MSGPAAATAPDGGGVGVPPRAGPVPRTPRTPRPPRSRRRCQEAPRAASQPERDAPVYVADVHAAAARVSRGVGGGGEAAEHAVHYGGRCGRTVLLREG